VRAVLLDRSHRHDDDRTARRGIEQLVAEHLLPEHSPRCVRRQEHALEPRAML
jgi:hypothetical protein